MKLREFILSLDAANEFLTNIGSKGYDIHSEITGTCTNYREFIDKVYEEFNNPFVVLNANVNLISEKHFKATYIFDMHLTEFEFEIIER